MGKIIYTVDVEKDLHSGSFKGVSKGLLEFGKICDKNGIKPVLFVTGEVVKKQANVLKRLHNSGWEISFHGYSHLRFDYMSKGEKEKEIVEGIKLFKSQLGFRPVGFRAPQHSIDRETLDLLEKHGFEYDSSYTPLNLLQLAFFPRRWKAWLRLFFSPLRSYKIRPNLEERPTSALIVPFVSLSVRVLPRSVLRIYVKVLRLFYEKPIFYAHSWDFIELPKSRIDRKFPHTKLLDKLDYVMKL